MYDFTTAQSKAYGTNPMVLLGDGNYGMYAGNNDGNNIITVSDYNAVANNLIQIGYNIADHNMNGVVTVTDYNFVANNLIKISQVP